MQRIVDFIIGAGILQGLFLALYLVFSKKKFSFPNKILALLLGAFSCNLLHSLFRNAMPFIFRLANPDLIEPFQLLIAPLFYLFVNSWIHARKWEAKNALHFLPFALVFLCLCLQLIYELLTGKPLILAVGFFLSLVFWGVVLLQYIFYQIISVKLIHQYNQHVEDFYSAVEKRKLDWLHFFFAILLVVYLGYFILFFILIHKEIISHFEGLFAVLQSFAILGLGYMTLFHESDDLLVITDALGSPDSPTREDKPSLSEEELARHKATLIRLMEEQKPYLDPELSLPLLAEMAGLSRNLLSLIINEGFGRNYYDFINSFRITEVQRMLQDPAKAHYKILALAFEAGFNSKPAFNAVFKKATGLTPSAYKKSL